MASLKPELCFWGEYFEFSINGVDEISGYWIRFKNGNPKYWIPNDVAWLRRCDCCGIMGSSRKVKSFCVCAYDDLCVSCWNRLRPIQAAKTEIYLVKKLIQKLRREITISRKAA